MRSLGGSDFGTTYYKVEPLSKAKEFDHNFRARACSRNWNPQNLAEGLELAVVATLGYLAVQIRQNTRHVQVQLLSETARVSQAQEIALLGTNPVDVLEKSIENPGGLTYADFRILDSYLSGRLELWVRRYRLSEAGMLQSDWKSIVTTNADWFFGDGFARLWWGEIGRHLCPKELAEVIDHQLNSGKGEESRATWLRIRARLE